MRRCGLIIALCLGAILISGCGGGSDSTQSSIKAQKAPQNAEEGVEAFGEEAGGSDREALLGAFDEYLGSLAEGDDVKTCELLASAVTESLQRLAAKAKEEISCAELLGVLLAPTAKQAAQEQAQGKVTKVRIKGDTAFVVFHAPGARLYELTMAKEDGRWKATTLSAAVLAPSLNH